MALPDKVIRKLEHINEIKSELNRCLSAMHAADRRRFWHQYEDVSSLQVVRDIQLLVKPVKLTFYWQQGTSIIKKSCGDFIEMMSARIRWIQSQRGTTDADRARFYFFREELAALQKIRAGEVIALCRVTAPSIRARVLDNGRKYSAVASTPLIYSYDCPVPLINQLQQSNSHGVLVKKYRKGEHPRAKLKRSPIIPGSLFFVYELQGIL
jgi:hypothetical protein